MHYVISSECPGVIYEEMDADFHMIKSVVPYRYQYHLRPETFTDNEIFCMVTNTANGTLELRVNPKHRLLRILEPVMYHPKVHRMMEVIWGEAQTRPAFWGDCPPHPAQHMPPCTGAEERGAVVRPEPAAGRAVWGEHTGRS